MVEPVASRTHIGTFIARALTGIVPVLALATGGCLDRPVTPARPTTTDVFVGTIHNQVVDKVDLLFMIDNSLSMGDKQEVLAQAVPVLVQRFVTPSCVDAQGRTVGVSDSDGRCVTGAPEFSPVKDIHLGVITSSLGSHGGSECLPGDDDATTGRTPDDRAELLPTANPEVRGPIPSWNDSGFLAWDPSGKKNDPPGESDAARLTQSFRDQVIKAGERGCGYEGSLESWYRFLVDPEPPLNVTTTATDPAFALPGPVNQTLLSQRKAFLRPDSLLAIVMLTDENDCSLLDDANTQGWLAASHDVAMPRASAACAENPDDRCCHTCAAEAPAGCTPNASDAECSKVTGKGYATVPPENDSPHLRCFDQKRRFGLDLLYPTQRYVDALTKKTVRNREGQEVLNPIFVAPPGMLPRSSSLVLLTGIVGVPWQDIATEASLNGRELSYLNAADLEETGRWDVILGGANGPSDPLMRESIAPRTGTNPVTGAALQAPTGSGDPAQPGTTPNPINGHEQNVVAADDLQYACTFPLPEPRPCTDPNDDACDCTAEFRDYARPLCEYTGAPGTAGTQIAAKAYPGLRELSVLRGVGDNGIVASICAKNMKVADGFLPETDASYGYNPAIAAMLDIVKTRLSQQCLPRQLPVETNPDAATFGQVPCAVVEAMPTRGGSCSCDERQGRSGLQADDAELRGAVIDQLRVEQQCDTAAKPACGDICLCRLESLTGAALTTCQNGQDDGATFGYCYVDPAQGIGNPELVKSCPAATRRSLRFVGEGLPANGSTTFIACQGAAARDAEDD